MLILIASLVLISQPLTADDKPARPPVTSEDPDQRIRCKSEEVTGTLAGRRKVCHTVAEWRQMADSASSEAAKMVDKGLIKPTNGQ